MEDLFDIAHVDAMKSITILEDRKFLSAQRENGHRGKMGDVDKQLAKKEEKALKKLEHLENLKKLEEEAKSTRQEKAVLDLLFSSSEDSQDDNNDNLGAVCGEPSTSKKGKRGR